MSLRNLRLLSFLVPLLLTGCGPNLYTGLAAPPESAAATPMITPAGGNYTQTIHVLIIDATPGTVVHYTTDGTTPTESSPVFTTALSVTTTTTVKAIAAAPHYTDSAVASATYTFSLTTQTPTFSPPGGTYTSPQSVIIYSTTPGAAIYYTTDGTTASTNSQVYTGPVTISTTSRLNAIALAPGYAQSSDGYADYNITTPALPTATPTFNPPAGSYTQSQSVAISDATSGAVVHFTTDGTTPTDSSPTFNTPISVTSTTTVKAIAKAPSLVDSAVASATYTISTTPVTTGEWVWMSGSSAVEPAANFGTQGIGVVSNTPGTRIGAYGAADSSNGIWLFGGQTYYNGQTANFNDLWIYETGPGIWAWISGNLTPNYAGNYGMQGVALSTNAPPASSDGAMWFDSSGSVLWMFGGSLPNSTGLSTKTNAMWSFDLNTKLWTLMNGSSTTNAGAVYGVKGTPASGNTPPNLGAFAACHDNIGNFWIFGGATTVVNINYVNGLWKFDPATDQWTWVSGSTSPNTAAIYGTQGVASATNDPGSRVGAACTVDPSGNVWVFGGIGSAFNYNGSYGQLNDLWEYSPATSEWTWIGGSNSSDVGGNWGVKGVPAPTNWPSAHDYTGYSQDASGNLYMFGGVGWDTALNVPQVINDLWKFDVTTKEWTWLAGSSSNDQGGNYGVLGVAAASNTPGAKDDTTAMMDSSGNFWLYGGYGYAAGASVGNTGDLWLFRP